MVNQSQSMVRRFGLLLFAGALMVAGSKQATGAEVTVLTDVDYGRGIIAASSTPREKPLKLDAYLPAKADAATPAIILAFGGAFHRGNKGDFQYEEDGARDTSMAGYCAALAARGIACFSIDYRLTPDDPALPAGLSYDHAMPQTALEDAGRVSRIEVVRARMGLAPLDVQSRKQLYNATFAGIQDAANALAFVRSNADKYGIASDKIIVGGFSAGATMMLNLAYGVHADVAGVVSLSGAYWGYELAQTIGPDQPPALMFMGQVDLPGIVQSGQAIAGLLTAHGNQVETAWVPGFGHFYPKEAPSLGNAFTRLSVIDRIARFAARVTTD